MYILKENITYMNKITLAQREALDVVKDMIDKSNTDVPDYGTKIMTLILGILNVDCRVEHASTDITDIDGGSTLPINPDNGNGKINLDMPDWIREIPTPPFSPHTPFPPQVWYEQETEPIQPTARELRYATEVSCTGDKTGIISVTNTADVRYNGDFSDEQTSFNDK